MDEAKQNLINKIVEEVLPIAPEIKEIEFSGILPTETILKVFKSCKQLLHFVMKNLHLTNSINLEDFFADIQRIDSIEISRSINLEFQEEIFQILKAKSNTENGMQMVVIYNFFHTVATIEFAKDAKFVPAATVEFVVEKNLQWNYFAHLYTKIQQIKDTFKNLPKIGINGSFINLNH